MQTQACDAISHALTITGGHTGLALSEQKVDVGPSGAEGVSNYVWTSEQIRVQGGHVGLVADFLQIVISTEVSTHTPDVVCVGTAGYHYVRVLFMFSRLDGTSFTANRLLMFKGPHFMRFM